MNFKSGHVQSQLEINRGDRAQALGVTGKGVKVAIHESGLIMPEHIADIPAIETHYTNPNVSSFICPLQSNFRQWLEHL